MKRSKIVIEESNGANMREYGSLVRDSLLRRVMKMNAEE